MPGTGCVELRPLSQAGMLRQSDRRPVFLLKLFAKVMRRAQGNSLWEPWPWRSKATGTSRLCAAQLSRTAGSDLAATKRMGCCAKAFPYSQALVWDWRGAFKHVCHGDSVQAPRCKATGDQQAFEELAEWLKERGAYINKAV